MNGCIDLIVRIDMKRITFGLLSCMIFGQVSAFIEVIHGPTFGDRLGFFMENTKDLMERHPNRMKGLMGALAVATVGAGYVAASYFDRLPASAPSVSTIKGEISKVLPKQTPLVIAAECVLGLAAAYLLQDVPAFVGSLFQDPFPDGK
jgi:hypothetical protein